MQSSQGKKRKKIHKILGDKRLSKQTLNAAKAEEERRQRILERQKLVLSALLLTLNLFIADLQIFGIYMHL